MKKFKGMTLVELTIILAIIGVLYLIVATAIENESDKISQGTVVSKSMTSPNPNPCIKQTYTLMIEGEKDGKIVEYAMYNVGDWYPKER